MQACNKSLLFNSDYKGLSMSCSTPATVLILFTAMLALGGCQPPGRSGDMRGPPAFNTLDLNGDGQLTLEEFGRHDIPRGDHAEIFKLIDTSGDGVISEEEYTSHRPPPQPDK